MRQHARRGGKDLIQDRVFSAQTFVGLGKVADVEAGAKDDLSGERLQLPQGGLEQCGLARAIGADQSGAITAAQLNIRRAKQQLSWISDLQAAGADDQITGATCGAQMQPKIRDGAHRRAQAADAALGLIHAERAGGDIHVQLRPVRADDGIHADLLDGLHDASQPAELALGLRDILPGNVLLDVLEVLDQLGAFGFEDLDAVVPAVLTLLEVRRVRAAVEFGTAERHLEQGIAGTVQEVAIVGDNHGRALPLAELTLEPLHGRDIEVIGGLVQQEHVGLREQQARQIGTRALPAGEMIERHVEIRLGETQAGEHLLDAIVIQVAAEALEVLLEPAVFFHGRLAAGVIRHFKLQAGELGLLADEFHEDRFTRVPDRAFELKIGLLGQIARAQTFEASHFAGRGLLQADQDAQQGGLADAIGADEGQARAAGNGKRNIAEDVLRAKGLGEGCGRDQ